MAKVTFQISETQSPVRVSFNYGTKKRIRLSTGENSPADFQNINADYTTKKNSSDYARNLMVKMRSLREVILNEYILSLENRSEINSQWMQAIIDKHFNREVKEVADKDIIANYLDVYIKNLERYNLAGSAIIGKQKYLQKVLREYTTEKKITLKFSNIDKRATDAFTDWLKERDGIMTSTTNRIRKNLKSCISYADLEDESIVVPPAALKIRLESVPKSEKSDIIYLNFDEIEQIKKVKIIGDDLVNAKHWLIISCFVGQRASDLFRMNMDMVKVKYDEKGEPYKTIDFIQQKTERSEPREISIPLHYEVENILKKLGGFPPIFSSNQQSNETLYNQKIKLVAELAGIHTLVKAKVFNENTKKNEVIETHKCYVLSSHVGRRSLASNLFGDSRISIAQLMAITGHSSQNSLSFYINKRSQDHTKETAKVFAEMERQANQ